MDEQKTKYHYDVMARYLMEPEHSVGSASTLKRAETIKAECEERYDKMWWFTIMCIVDED